MSEVAVLSSKVSRDALSSAGSVLIIDDEAGIRESLQILLEMEGFHVEVAEDCANGLLQLEQNTYDLVLLDFALPDGNGLDLLNQIHEREPQLAVIMITAYGTVENCPAISIETVAIITPINRNVGRTCAFAPRKSRTPEETHHHDKRMDRDIAKT